MGGASGDARNPQELSISRALLAALGQPIGVQTQRVGHPHDKEADQAGTHGKVEPHADDVQIDQAAGEWNIEGVERHIPDQQRTVGGHRNDRQDGGKEPGERRGGNGQRYKIIRHERVGRAARVIKQDAVDRHIEQQLQGVLDTGDRPAAAQPQQRQNAYSRRDTQGDQQRRPG